VDERKEGLMNGLRQLTLEQLKRVANYKGQMVLDKWNYKDGCFCPLAVGLGLHEWVRQPSHEKVYAIMAMGGLTINNTWGKEGTFYTNNRDYDLRVALEEVVAEKGGWGASP
jgi:hypothetical protein